MTPSNTLVLAIDQGGQSSRVALYRHTGERVCMFSAPCATRTYTDEHRQVHVEQDGGEILAGIRECLEQIEQVLRKNPASVIAAGFAGQGSSLLCWQSATGAALSPVLSWQDRRAESLLHDFPLSQHAVQQRTGIRISPHYGASKMRWCLDHIDAVKSAAASRQLMIGPIASYLFRNLLRDNKDRTAIDPGHAQRTLLWNLSTNDWDQELLDIFHIDKAILPTCVWHNSVVGRLRLGGQDVPLNTCQRDQGASLFARGMPEADACYINIGTGAFIQRVAGQCEAPAGLLVSPLWLPDPGHTSAARLYAWEATVNGAAAAIDWLQKDIGMAITPATIDSALATPLTKSDACFLNAVGGLSAPYWRTDLTSRFSDALTPAEKIQTWLESVLFQLLVNFRLMQSIGPAKRIYISGGLSRADEVCQRLADLTGVTVHRSDNTDATLQGVAFTTAGMPEQWRPQYDDDTFVPRHNPLLHERFIHWQDAVQVWLGNSH
jgi:glycerol kinase